MKKITFIRTAMIAVIVLFATTSSGWAQTNSYLGLEGGFEGSATIDNTTSATGGVSGKWGKANANLAIASETSTVRSGGKSLKVTSTSSSTCRVYSPSFTSSASTTKWVVQLYRRAISTTNSVQFQLGNFRGSTEALSGTYAGVTAANTWEKVTYVPTSTTSVTAGFADIIAKMLGTGGDVFLDDVCLYESSAGVDVTAASAPTSPVVGNPTTTSLDVSWTAASGGVDGGGYLVVRGIADPTTAPNANGIYAVGNTIAAGMSIVYQGTGTSFTDGSLASNTKYYYRIYTYDKAYNYSSALTTNGTTSSATIPVVTASQAYTPTVGVPFSQQIAASNSPTSFTLASGSFPAGLSMSTGGLVTGTPTAVGTTSPTINATNASGTSPDVAVDFAVGKGTQSITFGLLSSKYTTDGDYTISATASSGLGVTFSSSLPGVATVTGNTIHIAGAGTTTITAAQAGDANWNAASSVDRTLSVTVPAASQTITFNTLSHGTYGSTYADLSATATSGLSVSFASSNSTVATVTTGGVVTVVGPGTTTITATQAGNVSFNAATPVTQDLVVDVKPLTVTSPAVTSKTYDGLFPAIITGSIIGQLVGSDVVTLGGTGVFADVNANTGIAVAPTYTLGGANAAKYSITQPTGMTGDITKANQTITFSTAIPTKVTTDAPFAVTATASSGLTVTFESSNTNVATVSGSTVTIVGAGSATINAIQAGNGNYNAAPAGQNQALTVNPGAPVANAASGIINSGFTANWSAVSGATSYKLDVSTLASFSDPAVSLAGWSFPASGIVIFPDVYTSNNSLYTLTTNGGSIIDATGATTKAPSANAWDSGKDSKYWQIDANTTGYSGLAISSKIRSSSTGPKDFKLQYKAGVGAWTDVTGGTITAATDFTTGVLSELSLPSECDNQSALSIRWIMTSNTSVSNATVAAGGTCRIDDILLIKKSVSAFVSGYNDLTVNSTSQAVTGLTANTPYYYRVRAVGSSSTSSSSNTITTTPRIATPVALSPSQNWKHNASVDWVAIAGAQSYIVDLYTKPSGVVTPYGSSPYTIYGTDSLFTGLPYDEYFYTVKAKDAAYTTPASTEMRFVVDLATPIANATSSTAIYAANGRVMVSGATDFEVYNIQGMKLAGVKATADVSSIALRPGIYVVKTAGKVQKVVVR